VDEEDEDAPPGLLLPREDRLWRHPSEVGAEADVTRAHPTGAVGHRLRHRRRSWRTKVEGS